MKFGLTHETAYDDAIIISSFKFVKIGYFDVFLSFLEILTK